MPVAPGTSSANSTDSSRALRAQVPATKFRREKLTAVRRYIDKRVAHMNYDELLARDLELGTGPVEGAIKNLMGRRMDHGGMRWIKERAEAVLQLRCIEANGDWEAFVKHVHDKTRAHAINTVRLQQRHASPPPQSLAESLRDAA